MPLFVRKKSSANVSQSDRSSATPAVAASRPLPSTTRLELNPDVSTPLYERFARSKETGGGDTNRISFGMFDGSSMGVNGRNAAARNFDESQTSDVSGRLGAPLAPPSAFRGINSAASSPRRLSIDVPVENSASLHTSSNNSALMLNVSPGTVSQSQTPTSPLNRFSQSLDTLRTPDPVGQSRRSSLSSTPRHQTPQLRSSTLIDNTPGAYSLPPRHDTLGHPAPPLPQTMPPIVTRQPVAIPSSYPRNSVTSVPPNTSKPLHDTSLYPSVVHQVYNDSPPHTEQTTWLPTTLFANSDAPPVPRKPSQIKLTSRSTSAANTPSSFSYIPQNSAASSSNEMPMTSSAMKSHASSRPHILSSPSKDTDHHRRRSKSTSQTPPAALPTSDEAVDLSSSSRRPTLPTSPPVSGSTISSADMPRLKRRSNSIQSLVGASNEKTTSGPGWFAKAKLPEPNTSRPSSKTSSKRPPSPAKEFVHGYGQGITTRPTSLSNGVAHQTELPQGPSFVGVGAGGRRLGQEDSMPQAYQHRTSAVVEGQPSRPTSYMYSTPPPHHQQGPPPTSFPSSPARDGSGSSRATFFSASSTVQSVTPSSMTSVNNDPAPLKQTDALSHRVSSPPNLEGTGERAAQRTR